MTSINRTQVQSLIKRAAGGDDIALAELMPLMGEVLERITRHRFGGSMSSEKDPTFTLVNQLSNAWMGSDHDPTGRRLFFTAFVRNLHRVLVDRARGYLLKTTTLSEEALYDDAAPRLEGGLGPEDVIQLDDLLNTFRRQDPEAGLVLDFQFFLGLNETQIANVLGLPIDVVKVESTYGKAWLRRAMR